MGSGPVPRQSLANELAQRVRQMIRAGGYRPGDRLPSIASMARTLGVAHPTLREALRKLEALGMVEIRHGAGVFAGVDDNSLLISNLESRAGVSEANRAFHREIARASGNPVLRELLDAL